MEVYYQSSSTLRINVIIDEELADPDGNTVNITITRVSDGVVIVNGQGTTRENPGIYSYVLTPTNNSVLGKYKAVWSYTVSAAPYSKTMYYDVAVPYTTALEFVNEFPELTSKTDSEIYRKEKLARSIIDTFCNQKFTFEEATLKKVYCDRDADYLSLPDRCYTLTSILLNNTDDLTSEVELYDEFTVKPKVMATHLYDRTRDFWAYHYFVRDMVYYVTGNWGWVSVPDDISQATRLLMRDYFEDNTLLRQHGIYQTRMGDLEFRQNRDFWASTGNYDVDILISNYIKSGITLL
jgi:hypothetical protein